MRTFSVAVAVAVVLTFLCIQESSATFPEAQELEEAMSNDNPVAEYNDNPAAEHQETSVDSWMTPYTRHKRAMRRRLKCRFCCGCCEPGVCRTCCTRRF